MARILVTDDEEAIRKLLRQMLEAEGHTVAEAGDGEEAIAIARQDPADLLITDLFMPVREGLETIQEFRAEFPEMPIIAISGGRPDSNGDFLPVAGKLGANRTINKPFRKNQILEAVSELLEETS